jgi:hypothetical protein
MDGPMRPILLYFIPGVTFAFMCFMPAALQLSFMTTTLSGLLIGRILRSNRIRRRLGLYPMFTKQDVAESQRLRSELASATAASSVTPKTITVKARGSARADPRARARSQADTMSEYQAPAAASAATGTRSNSVNKWLGGVKQSWESMKENVAKQAEQQAGGKKVSDYDSYARDKQGKKRR